MSKLGDSIKRSIATQPGEPLWQGPEKDGITFSMLSRFLACRERFRLLVVKGLQPTPAFNHRLEYGSMFHVCLEAYAKGDEARRLTKPQVAESLWPAALTNYCRFLCAKYPTSQVEVDKWYNICKIQFPLYLEYWAKHPTSKEARTPLLQEEPFNIPYTLPSGRIVRLRGKLDSVYLVKELGKIPHSGSDPMETRQSIYLQENKTKGEIHESQIAKNLNFDLQTMIYLVALSEEQGRLDDSTIKAKLSHRIGKERYFYPIRGVLYNVIRRPLSGGKGSIQQYKPSARMPMGESDHSFYSRLSQVIRGDASSFFMRWQVEITQEDIKKFRVQCLDPILEQLCDWWDHVKDCIADPGDDGMRLWRDVVLHWRHPYGCYNALDEGGSSDYDTYLSTGSETGLHRATTLFPELEG